MKPRHYVVEMTPLEFACHVAGNAASLARILGTTDQVIGHWKRKGRVASAYVLAIEKATGVPRHELRPDLYPRDDRKRA